MSAAPVPKLFYHNSRLMRTIFLQLHRQQKDNTFCDVILQAEGIQIPVHSCILSACSPFFTERLSLMKPVAQQLVELSGMKASALSRLVQYIYTAELEVTRDEVEEVLAAARQLRILELEALSLEGGKLVKTDLGRRLNRDCFQSRTYFPRSGISISPVIIPAVAVNSHVIKGLCDSTISSRTGPCREVAVTAPETCIKPQEAPATKKEKVDLPHKDFDCIMQKPAVAESGTSKCLAHKLSRAVFKRDSDDKNKRNADLSMAKPSHAKATMLGSSLSKASNAADIGGLQPGKVKNKSLKYHAPDTTVTGISECSIAACMEGSESVAKYAREQKMPVKEVAKVCPQWESEPDLNRPSHTELALSSDHLALPKPDVSSNPASLVLHEMGVPSDHTSLALSVPEPSSVLTSFNAAMSFPIHFTNLYTASHSELSPTTQRKTFIKSPCITRKQSTSSDTSGDESPVGRMKLRKRVNSALWEVVHEREPEEEKQGQSGTCLREADTAVDQFLKVNPASSDSRVHKETSSVSAAVTTSELLHRSLVKPAEEQSHVEFAMQSSDQLCQAEYSIGSAQEVEELLDIVLSTSEASEFNCVTPDLEEYIMTEPAVAESNNKEEGKESIPGNQQVTAANHVFSCDEGAEGNVPADQQNMVLEHEKYTCSGEKDQMQCSGAESAPSMPRSPSHGGTSNLKGKLEVLMSSQNKPTGAYTSRKQQQAKSTTASSSGDCSDSCSTGLKPEVALHHRRSLRQMRKKKMQTPDGAVVSPAKYAEALLVTNWCGSDECIMPKRRWHSRTPRCVESVESGKGSLLSPKTSGLRETADCPSLGKQPLTSNSSPEVAQTLLDSEEEIDILGVIGGELPIIPCGIRPEPSSESDTDTVIVD